jgi:hypothetical protein
MHGRGPAGTRFHGEAAKLQLMANFDAAGEPVDAVTISTSLVGSGPSPLGSTTLDPECQNLGRLRERNRSRPPARCYRHSSCQGGDPALLVKDS